MVLTSNYWTLYTINPNNPRGYQKKILSNVEQKFKTLFPDIAELTKLSPKEERDVQKALLYDFQNENYSWSSIIGLSLRCYISHAIVSACQKLVYQFSDYGFFLQDILFVVLYDDGRTRNIRHLQKNSQSSCTWFWEEILRKFNPDKGGLWSLTYSCTRQHTELTKILWVENRLLLQTHWAILNSIQRHQMKTLLPEQRNVVEVFHEVYRRDRRERGARGKCPDPSESQLQEMCRLLKREIVFDSINELRDQLIAIAKCLQPETLSLEEHIDIHGDRDIPATLKNPDDSYYFDRSIEFSEERDQALMNAIVQVVPQHLQKLENSNRNRQFAPHFLPMLRLYYCENQSQSQIAQKFNVDQATICRQLKQVRGKIREQVITQLLPILLEEKRLNSNQGVLDKDAFDNVTELLSKYLDETVFIKATKKSFFAEKMRSYLQCNCS